MTTQSTYIGQNIGSGKIDRVITGAKHTLIISEIISICILSVVFVFANPIVTAFGLGAEATGYCASHVRCVAVCLIPFASYFPPLGLFQGANDALYSTFVATIALAVRVISTYCLQEIPAVGYRMVWWNTLFGWGLAVSLLGYIFFWKNGSKKQHSMIDWHHTEKTKTTAHNIIKMP